MVQVTPFLLVLSLALGAHNLSAEKCNLIGNWVNDLGSRMEILAVDGDGGFSGSYLTAVTASTNEIQKSPLQGSLQRKNQKGQPTFGFTVNWTFSDSITVFTGQCFLDKDGNEVLKTMWLLRSRVDDIEDDWKATRVGTNIFTRVRRQME
ncbi:avidin-like isoform X2 [Empidonax traillii]|uniref:avidin-like isoform X2 n=1 Tax=Empidonax traillii TaxID=164674 RepID=UPI000FFD479A|nr:avidin-like isoform X2 [Empidonax traillii]